MPWNGSGTYTLPYNWVNDANASIPITASRVDGQDGDIANGLNNCLTRDGQGAPSANLPMNGFRHTNCSDGVANTDYATVGQISLKAPLASPAFTGTPTAPTPATSDNSTSLATTAYVKLNLANYVTPSSPTFTGIVTVDGAVGSNSRYYLTRASVISGIIGISETAGAIIVGANQDDLCIRSQNGTIRFAPNGTTQVLAINSSGLSVSGAVSATSVSGTVSASTLTVGSGTSIPKITISTSAPGTLAVNELWFQRAT